MNKLRLNSECIGCGDQFTPNDDGVPLCGFCRNNVPAVRARLKTMLAVNNAALVDAINRFSEKDTARWDAIYQMKINLPRGASTKEDLATMRTAHSDFALRIAATKRKNDAVSAALQLQDTCKALQDKITSLDTLEHLS